MNDVKLRIDTRYFRFCIHKQALKAIGNPTFLLFGFEPKEQMLMIAGAQSGEKQAVRVRHDSSGSVYVFSKPLIEGIRQVGNVLMTTGSYLVQGEVRADERILIFSLKDACIISSEEERYETEAENG